MAELKDWNVAADSNNASPPDGAPEGMSRGSVNNTMREMMAVVRRTWQGLSGELEATSSDGVTYSITTAQTYTAFAAGIRFTFRAGRDSAANPTLTVGSLTADFKKVDDSGLVDLEAMDLLDKGVYDVVYVASEGFVVVGGLSGMAESVSESALTDQNTIAWDAGANPAATVTLGGNRTMGAPTNATAGRRYTLRVIQDGTGSRTLTWNSAFEWRSGSAPTLSTAANASDVFVFYYDGTDFHEVASSIKTTFDVHDDLDTELTAPANADRMPISDESTTGDPNRWISLQTLKTFFGFDVHDDLGTNISELADDDRLPISDESTSGDPNRYVTIAQLRAELAGGPNRNGAALASDQSLTTSYANVVSTTLTPSATASKVLMKVSVAADDATTSYSVRLRRGTTTVREIQNIQSDETPASGDQGEPVVIEALDSPNSTSQQTYTLQMLRGSGTISVSAGTFLLVEEIAES